MAINLNQVNYLDKIINFTYTFEDNKITSIIGPSGSGKSVLANLLLGVYKVDLGTIEINQEISNIPQDFSDYFLSLKVEEELKNISNEQLDKYLKKVNLDKKCLDQKIENLSKSEQFKLALILMLSLDTPYIILDEPTTYLDDKAKKQLIRLIYSLKKEENKTIIIISNDIDFVYEITDNIILLNKGKIKLQTSKDKLLKNYILLRNNGMEIPKILEFIYIAKNKKKKQLNLTSDMNELIKEIYRNVQ